MIGNADDYDWTSTLSGSETSSCSARVRNGTGIPDCWNNVPGSVETSESVYGPSTGCLRTTDMLDPSELRASWVYRGAA